MERVKPHSSLPSPGDFQEAFERAISSGTESGDPGSAARMSGTYGLARSAVKTLNIPVAVVDSKGPSMTLGWQVLAAARARETGADLEGILKRVEQVRNKLAQFVAMDTLEYLKTGGRIGGAARWAGTLLKVKPLVSINHLTGLVQPEGLVRTHSALVELLYRKFFETLERGKEPEDCGTAR